MKFFYNRVTKGLREIGWSSNRPWEVVAIQEVRGDKTGTTDTKEFLCEHGMMGYNFRIPVLGVFCEVEESPLCSVCAQQYLNTFSILCASCRKPIFPGTPVGQHRHAASHSYAHLTSPCCDSSAVYCGEWGEGCLIPNKVVSEKRQMFLESLIARASEIRHLVKEKVA